MYIILKSIYFLFLFLFYVILGNHMVSLLTVKRKAETIMKQASISQTPGSITMNEFLSISKKFPNILLPSIGKQ